MRKRITWRTVSCIKPYSWGASGTSEAAIAAAWADSNDRVYGDKGKKEHEALMRKKGK
eukprot:COSAG06_NODE_1466_length_9367_cov_6.526651_3_plen_58_part_00